MKVVFKVCCAPEEKQHQNITSLVPSTSSSGDQQQQPPQQHSTGISINQSKTKTPPFAQQVPQTVVGNGGSNGHIGGQNGGQGGMNNNGGTTGTGTSINSGRYVPAINTNTSNIVQSTMNWPQQTPTSINNNNNNHHYHQQQPFNPSYATSPRPPTLNNANNYNNNNSPSTSQTSLSHKPTKKTSKCTGVFLYLFVIQLAAHNSDLEFSQTPRTLYFFLFYLLRTSTNSHKSMGIRPAFCQLKIAATLFLPSGGKYYLS